MQESQKKPVQAGALAQASLAQQASIRDISIAIDTYDDIFSDFDPRPYSTRQVSHDFLVEIRARYKETRGGRIEVRFIVPDIERDLKTESVIKKRLREYFAQEKRRLTEAIKKIRYRGAVYVAGGALLLFLQTAAELTTQITPLHSQLLQILLVPAGWYGMFTGIEKLVETPHDLAHSIHIAERFENTNFIFIPESQAHTVLPGELRQTQ